MSEPKENPHELSDVRIEGNRVRVPEKERRRNNLKHAFKQGALCTLRKGCGAAALAGLGSGILEAAHEHDRHAVLPQFLQSLWPYGLLYSLATAALTYTLLRIESDSEITWEKERNDLRHAKNPASAPIEKHIGHVKTAMWRNALAVSCMVGIFSYGETRGRKAVEEFKQQQIPPQKNIMDTTAPVSKLPAHTYVIG